MPRKKFVPSNSAVYFITNRCINKEWFRIPMNEVWRIFENYLFFCTHAFKLEVQAFILMSNHFHLLARTPEANLDRIMNYFLREVSRAITEESGRINQTFGGPYHRVVIEKPNHYYSAYKYLYRNSVDVGLCERIEDYPYSTAHGLLGLSHLMIPTIDVMNLVETPEEVLGWLNSQPTEPNWRGSVSVALKKSTFAFSKDNSSGRSTEPSIGYIPSLKNHIFDYMFKEKERRT